jgi:hypothetical protein
MKTLNELAYDLYNDIMKTSDVYAKLSTIEGFLMRNAGEIYQSAVPRDYATISTDKGTAPSLPPGSQADQFGNIIWDAKTTVTLPAVAMSGKTYHIGKGIEIYKPNELQKHIYGIFEKHDLIKKCECGAEAIGVMKHSDYCAKHTKE